jgi:hypothetical protein
MSEKGPLSQRIARRLIACAGYVLQKRRADWAQAMRCELEHVPQGFAALRWSIGCLFASYKERAEIMEIGSLRTARISRVVLTLEMLLCFLVPTAALLGLFATIVLAGYSPFWGTPISALLLTTSLVGPLGLFLAFKSIVLEQLQMSKSITLVFSALAGWTFIGNTFFVLSIASPGYELRGIIITAILPVVGAAHLVYMANTERSTRAST